MSLAVAELIEAAVVNPDTNKSVRVRIKNIKSGRYLSIEGNQDNWQNDDASLTIRDWLGLPTLNSPQVWTIIRYREDRWTLVNQYSKAYASIRGRSQGNDATAIQYHDQFVTEPFQEWSFKKLENSNWLIRNINSAKFLGPHGRNTGNDNYVIQYDDQTSQDSYQEWVFEEL